MTKAVLLFFLYTFNCFIYGTIVTRPSITRYNGQYISSKELARIKPTSVYTCAEICLQMKVCKYFNFIMSEQRCDLHFGGYVKENPSTFYVKASEIPSEYAGICANHTCSNEERCFGSEQTGQNCYPLNIECGEPEVLENATLTSTGYLLGNTTTYTCTNSTVPHVKTCFETYCYNSTAFWNNIETETVTCYANKAWEYVDFLCTECFEDPFHSTSKVTSTLTKRNCKFWNSTSTYSSDQFSDNSIDDAANYCRSPIAVTIGARPYLWCLTDDPKMLFDICAIPECFKEEIKNTYDSFPDTEYSYQHHFADVPLTRLLCMGVTDTEPNEYCPVSRYDDNVWSTANLSCSELDCYQYGKVYQGKIQCTVSGRTCQNWNSQFPHNHSIVLQNATDQNSNFCRDPDGGFGMPWCFTTDPEVKYEYCWIPEC